jgi:hypothetical protein
VDERDKNYKENKEGKFSNFFMFEMLTHIQV